jgi:hypothetical protein
MEAAHDALTSAIDEVTKARSQVMKYRAAQVRAVEQRQFLRSVAFSWFRSRRDIVRPHVQSAEELGTVDQPYRVILDSSEKAAARATYLEALQEAKAKLIALRANLLVQAPAVPGDDQVPDFSSLAADPVMRDILARRWDECRRCIGANAHLAATVMMGGLLEALFVARANRLTDKSPLFKATTAPRDKKTKKPLDLRDWTLRSYIDVGHELKWITKSGSEVASVLRDYRNYVHPEKERAHAVVLGGKDSEMFWGVTKNLARQLLAVTT